MGAYPRSRRSHSTFAGLSVEPWLSPEGGNREGRAHAEKHVSSKVNDRLPDRSVEIL
jgi:hypothetical protein